MKIDKIEEYKDELKELSEKSILLKKCYEHLGAMILIEQNQDYFFDCSFFCYNYQQLLEKLMKHCIEINIGDYFRGHKLKKLLELLIQNSDFRVDKSKYNPYLLYITSCAENYRYDEEIDCEAFRESFLITKELLNELIKYAKEK